MIPFFPRHYLLFIQDDQAHLYIAQKKQLVLLHQCILEQAEADPVLTSLRGRLTVLVNDEQQVFNHGTLPHVSYFERSKLVKNAFLTELNNPNILGGYDWHMQGSSKIRYNTFHFKSETIRTWLSVVSNLNCALMGFFAFPFALKTLLSSTLGIRFLEKTAFIFDTSDQDVDFYAFEDGCLIVRRRITKASPSFMQDLTDTLIYLMRSHGGGSTPWCFYSLIHASIPHLSRIVVSSGFFYETSLPKPFEKSDHFREFILQALIDKGRFGPKLLSSLTKTLEIKATMGMWIDWGIRVLGCVSAVSCLFVALMIWNTYTSIAHQQTMSQALHDSLENTHASIDVLKLARLRINPLFDLKKIADATEASIRWEWVEWYNPERAWHQDRAFLTIKATLIDAQDPGEIIATLKESFPQLTITAHQTHQSAQKEGNYLEGTWLNPRSKKTEIQNINDPEEIIIEIKR